MAATKVLVTRKLPEQGSKLLQEASKSGRISDLVQWPEDRACDRAWLLQNVKGATGLIVMLNDKVCVAKHPGKTLTGQTD